MAARDQFKLTGIQRNRKNREFKPGTCNELINLRFREGAWECVGNKKLYDTITGYTPDGILALHSMIDSQNIIFKDGNKLVSKQVNGAYTELLTNISGSIKCETLNNVLIVILVDSMEYFVWKDGAYKIVVHKFDQFNLKRYIDTKEKQWAECHNYYYNYDDGNILTTTIGDGSSGNSIDFISSSYQRVVNNVIPDFETLLGVVAKLKTDAQEIGIPIHNVYFIATLELFDGTEVCHTPVVSTSFADIIVVRVGFATRVSIRMQSDRNTDPAKDVLFKFKVNGLGDKSLIKRINFYISKPLPVFVKYWDVYIDDNDIGAKPIVSPMGYSYGDTRGGKCYRPNYVKEPLDEALFYQIASVPITEMDSNNVIATKFENINNIDTYKVLNIDNYSRHKITSKSLSVYNGRLFSANITTKFPLPLPLSLHDIRWGHMPATIVGSAALLQWYIDSWGQTVINDIIDNPDYPFLIPNSYNGHMVKCIISESNVYTELGYYTGRLGTFATFTLSNKYAVFTEVFYSVKIKTDFGIITVESIKEIISGYTMIKFNSTSDWEFYFPVVGLISYPDSRAYEARIYYKPLYYTVDGGEAINFPPRGPYTLDVKMKPSETQNFSFGTANNASGSHYYHERYGDILPPSTNLSIQEVNRVQASALNNPFVFPAANSYRVGNSEVIGLQTVNNEMSQGQFGDFPMIAFTKSGIWAMKIGSGDLLISSVVPLANELCNNTDSIVAIRKGILFSTVEGLKILQGANVLDISDMLEGSPDSAIKSGSVMSEIISIQGFLSSVSDIDFLEYVKGAKVGYDDYNEELIVSNPTKHYSYIFSIINNSWSKTDQVYDGFLSKYPFLLAFKDNLVYKANEEIKVIKKGLFITNEMNFNNTFTMFEQAVLRGKFKSGRIIVFGTTDHVRWKLICIGTSTAGGYDIHIPRSFYSCLAFVIAFDGSFEGDSYLQHIDIELKQRYGHKFR